MSKILYPDTSVADISVERYLELNGKISKKNKDILYLLASHSRFLGRVAANDPELIPYIAGSKLLRSEKLLEDYNREIKQVVSKSKGDDELIKNLRVYKYRELAMIIYKNVAKLSDFVVLLRELSSLSESLIASVHDHYADELGVDDHGKFFVIAMGKLGGRLLNLSSDVDLIYIYDEKQDGEVFFQLAEKITNAVSVVTERGFLYRVDLGLRPGGSRSPIAISYEGAVEHYYYWGDTWERAAFIQARPIAGDMELGQKFIKDIDKFVYKKSLDYESIEDLKDMKFKIDKLEKKNDVKLGRGGIREIEFFVQANQLVNAGQFNELKGKNALEGLKLLAKKNIVNQETEATLEEAYIFLRQVEHNIQLVDELQTQRIPTDKEELLKLAKRTGFDAVETFEEQLQISMDKVAAEYGELFHEPSKKTEEYAEEFWQLADFFTEGNVKEEEAIKLLSELGFKNPSVNLDVILSLVKAERSGLTQKGRQMAIRVIPAFLSAVLKSYDSDTALRNMERFVSSTGCKTSVYATLSENPDLINRLSMLFSTSGVLSNFLIRYPEYLNILTIKFSESQYSSEDEMFQHLQTLVAAEKDYEDKLNALRHFKHVETLKLCLRDLSNEVDPVYVGKYLSMIASAVLNVALDVAMDQVKVNKRSKASLKKMLVVGMGKFGSQEMSYKSDLDMIFIYEGDHETFSKLGQRLISVLSVPTSEGSCYEIDLDLRPSGKSGTLVVSFDMFEQYHEKSAHLWERQSLIKSSPIAGDQKLSQKIQRAIRKFVYLKPLKQDFHNEMSHLRHRMENELAKETVNKVNVKTGRGGLVDIEFIVQMLQLKHGKDQKSIRLPNTLEAIDAMKSLNILTEENATALSDGYMFLKGIENHLRLLKDKSISDITDHDFDILSVESIKYGSGEELKAEYMERTKNIRKIYKDYFKS